MFTLFFFSFLAGFFAMMGVGLLPLLPPLLSLGLAFARHRIGGFAFGFVTAFSLGVVALQLPLQLSGAEGRAAHLIAALLLLLFGLFLLLSLSIQWRLFLGLKSEREQVFEIRMAFAIYFVLGAALAFLWTPWIGPFLHTLLLLAALENVNATALFMLLFYATGALLLLLLITWGVSCITVRWRQRGGKSLKALQLVFGLLTIAVALQQISYFRQSPQHYTERFSSLHAFERSRIAQRRLSQLIDDATKGNLSLRTPIEERIGDFTPASLPVLGQAPALPQLTAWYNSPPLADGELRGHAVLLEFWNYSCLSCLRSLPYLQRWHRQYKDRGLLLLAIHTPEFAFEREGDHVAQALQRLKINYPVALDNERRCWNAFGNLYWPTHYLLDSEGKIRYVHFGEGDYLRAENAIRQLLKLPPLEGLVEQPRRRALTPEIYLGYGKASSYPPGGELQPDQDYRYTLSSPPNIDQVALEGSWLVEEESITAKGADSAILLSFLGRYVYATLSGQSDVPLLVELDGRSLTAKQRTSDFDSHGDLYVKSARNYFLLDLGRCYGRHMLRLKVPKGVKLHTFAFGDELSRREQRSLVPPVRK